MVLDLFGGQVDHLPQLGGGIVETGGLLGQPGLNGVTGGDERAEADPAPAGQPVAVGGVLGGIGRLEAVGLTGCGP